nr:BON domain-containing protein [Pseudomonas sp. HMWF006]
MNAADIGVSVENVVTLEGRGHLWRERQNAEPAAWSVRGVTRVEDHLCWREFISPTTPASITT